MGFSYLLAHARPYRARLALIALLTILSSLAVLAIPWLAGQLLGGMLSDDIVAPGWIVTFLLSALVAGALLTMASSLVSSATAASILADLRRDIFVHVQSLPMGFHDQQRQGDLLALLSYEVARLSRFIAGTLASTPSSILMTLGTVILLFWIDPALALLIPILVPAFYLILKVIGRGLRSLAQACQEAEASVMASAEEALEMLPAIKAFTREEAQRDAYAARVDQSRLLYLKEARIYAVLSPAISLVAALAAVALVLLASSKLEAGAMSASELFSFLFYTALLTRPVGSLAHLYGQFQTARGTLARLQRIVDLAPEPGYAAPGHLERCRGAIAFNDVWFTYPGRAETIRGVTLDIKAGEIIALTGENGAGKSTLVALLLGFYAPDKGQIALDGQDIAGIQVQDLRRQIGYVPQRPLLFNGTIRENIAFGRENASEEEIERAMRLAQAYEFVSELPQELDTEIGDHGVRLSGGQRQRIALARALIKDPPILVLDEATAMYDLEGETAFVEACGAALEGRSVIIITHRQASLAMADRIIALDQGRIVGSADPGTPAERAAM